VPCSRCADKNLPCAARFARRSCKVLYRSNTTNTVPQAPENNGVVEKGKSQGQESIPEIRLDRSREGSLQESHSHPDLIMWGSTQEQCVDSSQSIHFSTTPFEDVSKHQEGFSEVHPILNGAGEFDPKHIDMGTLSMWSNCPMDLDMCANNGIDFSNQMSIHGLWFESSESMVNALPSPPSTGSATHSRINSISPMWAAKNESCLPEASCQYIDSNNGMIPELDIVIAAEEAWPLAKCNPRIFSGSCPRTAIVHLEAFQNCSKLEGAWDSMNDMMAPTDENTRIGGRLEIVPIHTTTRDKVIAFAQSFLVKALTTHLSGMSITPNGGMSKPNFFTLPPSNVLENLLRCSVQSLSPYYSLIHGTALDPNELMINDDTSTLLFLLMMAQGASTVPKAEARYLAAGLTETCRISLFDVIEKNVELSADPIVLKSAFLFTQLGAWGGDAWRMFYPVLPIFLTIFKIW